MGHRSISNTVIYLAVADRRVRNMGAAYSRRLPSDVQQTASARHAFVSAANEIGTTQSVKTARMRCGIVPFTRLSSHGEGHMLGIIARREFITLLGCAAVAWPLAARAQQPAKVPTIGFLGSGTPITAGAWVVAFAQRLRELGWIEDRTIKIDLRWAEGRNDRSAEIVTDFVRLKVDVIVTYGSEHIQIAKEATSTIPIVALMGDPVGSGLVASLAHPGGNLTGLSAQNADLNGKRFELLHEIVPNLRRLAVLFNGNNLAYRLESDIVRAAAIPLGLEVLAAEIRSGDDIAPTFAAIATDADALLVVGEPLTFTYRSQISALALAARLPTTYSTRGYVEAGGLMSYGPNFPALFRRMADYVNKILRGTKPEDLPVEQPTRYDLIVNLTTAKALGLKIPESFLLRADEVIE
jgi:putative tryptophan/tyrosine transport system substrate-binding protein